MTTTTGQTGRTNVWRLTSGEDLVVGIANRAKESHTQTGTLMVIGTLAEASLGYYKDGQYSVIHLDGPIEIASGIGNIALDEKGEPIIHCHLVVSNSQGQAFGGHLMKGSIVGATAELVITQIEGLKLIRLYDDKTGLRLLDL